MSFSSDVKLEIIKNKPMLRRCKVALTYGLLLYSKNFSLEEISLITTQKEVFQIFERLLNEIFNNSLELKRTEMLKGEQNYRIGVVQKKDRQKIIDYFKEQSNVFLANEEDIHAFLAGAFLACGNITDPQKSYHLEFVASSAETAETLVELLLPISLKLRTMLRRNKLVVYCKDSKQIIDALTMMGANSATFRVIDVELLKGIRNNVNRVTNCETANIDKMVTAATAQIEDIKMVLKTKGEANLKLALLETAKIRIENPYSSLRELAQCFNPPISRSGLHHRLTALSKIADKIREENKEEGNV